MMGRVEILMRLKARKDQMQGILLYQNLKGIFPIPQLFNWLTN